MNRCINKLLLSVSCRLVGKDEFGNMYYESRRADRTFGRKSRHVVYKGEVEATKIPAQWFSWIHFQISEPPKNNVKAHKWEKEHTPNLTGTRRAYLPSGHILAAAKRDKATGDYEAWKPKD
jgi:NADH:ubiquinone oxidoreductase subunit